MNKLALAVLATGIGACALGCSDATGNPIVSGPNDSGSNVDAAKDSDAGADAGNPPSDAATDAPKLCNSLVPGALVTEVAVAGPVPTDWTGGTVISGTYDLTDATYYCGGGCTPGPIPGEQSATVIAILGDVWQWSMHQLYTPGGGPPNSTTIVTDQTWRYSNVPTSTGSLSGTIDCATSTHGSPYPIGPFATGWYSVVGTTLTVGNPAGYVSVFTRR